MFLDRVQQHLLFLSNTNKNTADNHQQQLMNCHDGGVPSIPSTTNVVDQWLLSQLFNSIQSSPFFRLPMAVEEVKPVVVEQPDEKGLLENLMLKEARICKNLFDELLMLNASQNLALSEMWLRPTSGSVSPCGTTTSSFSSALPEFVSSSSMGQQHQKKVKKPTTAKTARTAAGNTEARPHKCDQCQKAFRFKSNLFEHKSLHLGDRKPFVCPFCAKSCRLKGNLKKHLQIHVTSVEDLERLWKRSFSRQSGRPRKNAEPAPLPKPGDDLGLVPVLLPNSSADSTGSTGRTTHHSSRHHCSPLQWTFADDVPMKNCVAEADEMDNDVKPTPKELLLAINL